MGQTGLSSSAWMLYDAMTPQWSRVKATRGGGGAGDTRHKPCKNSNLFYLHLLTLLQKNGHFSDGGVTLVWRCKRACFHFGEPTFAAGLGGAKLERGVSPSMIRKRCNFANASSVRALYHCCTLVNSSCNAVCSPLNGTRQNGTDR